MIDKPTKHRFYRLLRLPSFGVALGVSLAALLSFAVWMFVDASFPVMLEVVRIDLRLQEHPGIDMSDLHAWEHLGTRMLLFAVLAGIGVLATLLVFYRILFGSRHGRSLRSLFLAVALISLWLGLTFSHEKLESAGFHWRLRSALQGLKQDAEILSAEWPTSDGELPYSGEYTVHGDGLLLALDISVVFFRDEFLGPFIRRADNGGIMFDYGFDDRRIQYHPNGTRPASLTDSAYRWVVDRYVELEPNWFLVSYLPDLPGSEVANR